MRISHAQSARITLQQLQLQRSMNGSSTSTGSTSQNQNSSLLNRLQNAKNIKQINKDALSSTVSALGQRAETLRKKIATATARDAKSLSGELEKIAAQLKSITQGVVAKSATSDKVADKIAEQKNTAASASGTNSSSKTDSTAKSDSTSQSKKTPQDSASVAELKKNLLTVANKVKQAVGQLRAKVGNATPSVRDALSSAEKMLDGVISKTTTSSSSSSSSSSSGTAKSAVAAYDATATSRAGSVVDETA